MPILETGHDHTPASAGHGIAAPDQVTKTIITEPVLVERVASKIGDEHIIADAAEATQQEREMGVLEAFKAYPKAVAWSMLFSMAIIQEGFDFAMVFSFYALPAFQRRYGELLGDGTDTYIITPAWQAGLSNAVQVGSIIGLLINGWACDRFGYRKTLMVALISIIGFIFITFFAVNLPMLLVGEFLCGIPWGVFQTLTTAYAAEVCPLALRQYLTTYVNLCWVMGQFLSSGVLKGVSTLPENNSIAYRLPFALQWIWPIPILIGAYFAPESPWYLVRQGRLDEAADSLRRFGSATGSSAAIDIQARVAQMQYTNEFEKAANAGTSYFDCFKGVNLRRTEIVCIVWMIQTACGSPFIGFSNTLYERAGLSVSDAFSLSLGQYALGAVGTISSWWTMAAYGRRPLYLWGCVAMMVTLFIVGGAAFISGDAGAWTAGSFIFFFSFLYQFTVGPVCYCLVAEIPSTRLRAKSVVLARGAYNLIGILANIIVPRMLSQAAWNWGSKSGFFFAGANILCIAWIYFRLPETKGRTFAELDALFEERVSARNFKTTAVDLFRHHGGEKRVEEPDFKGIH